MAIHTLPEFTPSTTHSPTPTGRPDRIPIVRGHQCGTSPLKEMVDYPLACPSRRTKRVTETSAHIRAANHDALRAVREMRKFSLCGLHPVLTKCPSLRLEYYVNLETRNHTDPGRSSVVLYQPLTRWDVSVQGFGLSDVLNGAETSCAGAKATSPGTRSQIVSPANKSFLCKRPANSQKLRAITTPPRRPCALVPMHAVPLVLPHPSMPPAIKSTRPRAPTRQSPPRASRVSLAATKGGNKENIPPAPGNPVLARSVARRPGPVFKV